MSLGPSVTPGSPAPATRGKLASDEAFDLAALRGSKVLVEFLRGTW